MSIKLYGADGRLVRTFLEDRMGAGVHSISVDRSDLAAGTRFYRIQVGSFCKTRSMTIMP